VNAASGGESRPYRRRTATVPATVKHSGVGDLRVLRDIWLLRQRVLLAQAHGDAEAYKELRDHYRDMAKTLGYEGHIAWAYAMP
jgi:hypothetical protein